MNETRGNKGRLALVPILVFLGISFACVGYGEPGNVLQAQDIRENIYDSTIISTNDYLMVGDRGKIFRSSDTGKTWREVVSGTRLPLYSVRFPDSKNGWIAGKSGLILHTKDSGETWSHQITGTSNHLFSIDFTSDQQGCAVGDWGAVLVTEDGGTTWQDASLTEDVVLYGVGFADSHNGWVVGEFGRVLKTVDGGRNWSPVELPLQLNTTLFCVSVNAGALYAAGLDGIVIYSKDGGETWHYPHSVTEKALYSIAVQGASGWAAGDAGTILQTEDGGKSWHLVDIPEQKKLFWVGTVSLSNGGHREVRGFGAGASGLFFSIEQNNLLWGNGGERP